MLNEITKSIMRQPLFELDFISEKMMVLAIRAEVLQSEDTGHQFVVHSITNVDSDKNPKFLQVFKVNNALESKKIKKLEQTII